MIAARQMFLGRGGAKVPTAADYVQDGLAAMWDGIENAGRGIHDANAESWRDIVRGIDCQWTGNANAPTWESDCWVSRSSSDGYFVASYPDFTGSDGSTVEFVALKSKYGRGIVIGSYMITDANNVNFEYYTSYRPRAYYNGNPDVVTLINTWPVGERKYFACVADKLNYPHYTIFGADGQLLKEDVSVDFRIGLSSAPCWIGNDGRLSIGFNGKIFAIRIYNRALTAAKIAANYAVDKARFNLP